MNPEQQTIDPITYFGKFKAIKKFVEELNHTASGHVVVEIICKE